MKIMSSLGKSLSLDKKSVKNFFSERPELDKTLFLRTNGETVTFGEEDEGRGFFLFGRSIKSSKSFDTFDSLWSHLEKNWLQGG